MANRKKTQKRQRGAPLGKPEASTVTASAKTEGAVSGTSVIVPAETPPPNPASFMQQGVIAPSACCRGRDVLSAISAAPAVMGRGGGQGLQLEAHGFVSSAPVDTAPIAHQVAVNVATTQDALVAVMSGETSFSGNGIVVSPEQVGDGPIPAKV